MLTTTQAGPAPVRRSAHAVTCVVLTLLVTTLSTSGCKHRYHLPDEKCGGKATMTNSRSHDNTQKRRLKAHSRQAALVAAAAVAPLMAWMATSAGAPSVNTDYPVIAPVLRGNALRRHKVLAAVPKNVNALVNVRYEHLPATDDLTILGKKALPALERGLTHNVSASVRQRIATVLTEMADHHSVNALIAALKDWDATVRRQAIRGLAAIGSKKAVPVLLKVVDDPEEKERVMRAAVRALGWIGAGRTAKRLLKILWDKEESSYVKETALRALWDMRLSIPPKSLRRAIVKALGSEDDGMVVFAAAAAAELRDKSARIRKALAKLIRDNNANVRNVAVYALGEIGDPRSIRSLRAALPRARSGRLLNNIAFALRKMGDPTVIPLLGKLLRHRQAVIRLNAAFVLGDIRDKNSVPMLLGMLKDRNDIVRASAISALGKLKDARAVNPLLKLSRKGTLAIRKEALFALNNIISGRYNDRIVKELLMHKKSHIRRQAALELARRGDRRAIAPLVRCLDSNGCGAYQVAVALGSIPSYRATAPLLTAYTRQIGKYGSATSLCRAVGKRKLNGHQRAVLRSLLQIAWNNNGDLGHLIQLLGRLEDRGALAAYWSLLKSRDPYLVQDASYAVANTGYRQGRKRLLTGLTQAAPRIKGRIAGLIRSLTHKATRTAVRPALGASMKGHGVHTELAAAYALTSWDATAGIRILLSRLKNKRRRVRGAAGKYLLRKTLRPHGQAIRTALRTERNLAVKGMLRRIISLITPASFKPKLLHSLPL
jgi:HEAT repeat protein